MAVGSQPQPGDEGGGSGAPGPADPLTSAAAPVPDPSAAPAPAAAQPLPDAGSAATPTDPAPPAVTDLAAAGADTEAGEAPSTADTFAAGPGGGRSGRHERRDGSGPLGFLKELPVLLLIAFVLALLIKTFLVQAFYIPSVSMDPTLKVHDRVLVNKLTYRFHEPRRGDIIVFEDPNAPPVHRNPVSAFAHWVTDGLGLTTSPDKDFIKRVIGLPGETIEVRHGTVFVDGTPLGPEPYLSPILDTSCCEGRTWHVPPGDLFVMGDNRTDSNDSRGTLGFIPISKVVGRAFVVIWPPSRIHWLTPPHYSSS